VLTPTYLRQPARADDPKRRTCGADRSNIARDRRTNIARTPCTIARNHSAAARDPYANRTLPRRNACTSASTRGCAQVMPAAHPRCVPSLTAEMPALHHRATTAKP